MKWEQVDEAVEILQKRFQYFPQVFCWRGGHYAAQSVEKCWSVCHRGWRRRVARHYFRLRCPEGRFELYQDVRANTWHLGRAMLGADSSPPLAQTARG
jgi:hypothetical protein